MKLKYLYEYDYQEWTRWRDAYKGGRYFVDGYLQKLNSEETDASYTFRKELSYCPAVARESIDRIKNAFCERLPDIKRTGGSTLYQQVMKGQLGGVDYQSNSMNNFIAEELLIELFVMGKVGVFVDNFTEEELGLTQLDALDKHPFLTTVPRNHITDLEYDRFHRLSKVSFHGTQLWMEDGFVHYKHDEKGDTVREGVLNLREIPFVIFEITHSLMRDVADIQVTLMNQHSSDIMFMRNNIPLYYEYGSQRRGNPEYKQDNENEIEIGWSKGRRVPIGGGAPGYVSPDPEILRVSMEKSKQLEDTIRSLIHLNLENQSDSNSMESGLSNIARAMEKGENQIARFFDMYAGFRQPAVVSYPDQYQLKSDEDRRKEAGELASLANKIPSSRFHKETSKAIVDRLFGGNIPQTKIDEIHAEIEQSSIPPVEQMIVLQAVQANIVDPETAAEALGFDRSVAKKAMEALQERVTYTIMAQNNAAQTGMSSDRGFPGGESLDENQRGEGKDVRNDS